jgi:hypothetical protein
MTAPSPFAARCTSSGRRYSPACGVQPQWVGAAAASTFVVPCRSKGRRYPGTGDVLSPGNRGAVACCSPAPRRSSPLLGGGCGRDLRSPLQEQGTKMPRHRWCPSTRWQRYAHFRAAIGVLCMSKARRSSSVAVSNRKREEEIDLQGRRTQSSIRALFSNRLRLSVSRWGANEQPPRAPTLPLRLASQQRAEKLLIVSISALQKAREQGRLIAAPIMPRTTSELFAPANSGDPHPARGEGAAAAIFAQNMPACTHVFVGVVAPVIKSIVRDGVSRRPSPWCSLRQVIESLKTTIFRSTYVLAKPGGRRPPAIVISRGDL